MGFEQCRKRAGLTQEQVAEKLGVDRTTVSKWDTATNMPRADLLFKIASLYGCDVNDLLSTTDTKSDEESIPGNEGKDNV